MAPSTNPRSIEQLARLVGLAAALRQAVALEATTGGDDLHPCCHRGCGAGCTEVKEEEKR
jgi:hypothetical protein